MQVYNAYIIAQGFLCRANRRQNCQGKQVNRHPKPGGFEHDWLDSGLI
jgi:hypothetical protein